VFDKLTLRLSEAHKITYNFNSNSLIKMRNLYNLFLNKHSLEMSTLLQSNCFQQVFDDEEFDKEYTQLFYKEYPDCSIEESTSNTNKSGYLKKNRL